MMNIELIQPVYNFLPYTAIVHLNNSDLKLADKYDIEYEWLVMPQDIVTDMEYDTHKPFVDFKVRYPDMNLQITCIVKFIDRATGMVVQTSTYNIQQYYKTTFDGMNTTINRDELDLIKTPPMAPLYLSYNFDTNRFADTFNSIILNTTTNNYIHSYKTQIKIRIDNFEYSTDSNGVYRTYDENGNITTTQAIYTSGPLDDVIDSTFRVLLFDGSKLYIQFIKKGTYKLDITTTDYNNRTETISTNFDVIDIPVKMGSSSVLLHHQTQYAIQLKLQLTGTNMNKFEQYLNYIIKFILTPRLIQPSSLDTKPIPANFSVNNIDIDNLRFSITLNSTENLNFVMFIIWYAVIFTAKLLNLNIKSNLIPYIEAITKIESSDLFNELTSYINNNYENIYKYLDKDVVYDTITLDTRNFISSYGTLENCINSGTNNQKYTIGT